MQIVAKVDRPRADWAYRYLDVLRDSGQAPSRRSRVVSALCVQKTLVYRQSLDAMSPRRLTALRACDVPTEVDSLLDVPSVSPWVPETHAHAYFLTIAQLCHASEADFLRASYVASLRLYQQNRQRLMLLAVSPLMVVKGGPRVWQQIHHGTQLSVEPDGDTGAVVRLAYPPHHLDALLARMYAVCFEASLHIAGAVDARVTLDAYGISESVWRARW